MKTVDQHIDAGAASLPPFYKSITPLFSKTHEKLRLDGRQDYSFAASDTAIVLTVYEFAAAERDYPIVFTAAKRPMPVVLTGAPGGQNDFVSPDGQWKAGAYIPAYVLRYPFILARLGPDATDLTLCFDPTSSAVAEGAEGNIFISGVPSSKTKAMLALCGWFESAVFMTEKFVRELMDLDLLMDARADIRIAGKETAVFQGFQIVSEEKLRALSDEQVGRLARSGALALIHAHLLSLKIIARLFVQLEPKGRSAEGARADRLLPDRLVAKV